jgi:amino acid transporter
MGTNDVKGFITSSENPCFRIARQLWGKAWILIFVAVLNSVLAVSIACTNAASRVFFAMGRSGALPRWLAKVHPRYRTPTNAIWTQTLLTFVIGLGLGFWIGPDQEYYFLGITITLGLVLVYGMSNYGVFRFYRGERKGEFRLFLHFVCPLVSTLVLIWVAVQSVLPLPPAPLRYAPSLVVCWVGAGVLLLWHMKRRGREKWLVEAGQAAHEGEMVITEEAKCAN